MKTKAKKIGLWIMSISLWITPWMITDRICAVEPSPSASVEPSEPPESEKTPEPSPQETPEEPTIVLSEESIEIEVGSTKEVTATIKGTNVSDSSVTWKVLSGNDVIKITQEDTKVIIEGVKKGEAEIDVTANANGIKSKTLKVTVKEKEPEKSNDATLKSLKIVNATLDPAFSPDTLDYIMTVTSNNRPYIDEKNTEPNHPKATMKINASVDGNTIEIIVTAEDGTTKTYKITKKQEETVSVNLKSLKVNGYTLNEPFSSSRTNYTLEIPYEAEDISIEVGKENAKAKVTINGATGLKVGKNEVKITVQNDTGNSKVYIITVTRAAKEESEDKVASVTTNNSSNITGGKEDQSDNLSEKNHLLQYILVTIGCLILFAIGALGIYFYCRTSMKGKNPSKGKSSKEKDEEENLIKEPTRELERTREFTDVEKAAENKKRALENDRDVRKNIEDLFDDE